MKIAACFSTNSIDCQAAVEKMTGAMQLSEGQKCGSFTVPGGSIGYVTSSERFSSIPLLREAENGNVLMISGVPIDLHVPLDSRLQEILTSDFHKAQKSLHFLDGAFAALFWDAQNQKLVIVTDCLGIQPLYIAKRDGLLLLATELKAFSASGLVDVEMDPAGWGAFVSLGFNIADHTQLAGVKLVDSATILVYDPAAGSLESKTHWSWPEPKPEMKLADVDTVEMLRIMRCEIEGYASHCQSGTVLLSGGFDSRLILVLLNQAKIDCRALVVKQMNSSAEAHFAARIAKRLNCRNIQRIDSSWDYYSTPSYLKYLLMNEVTTPSMRLYITPFVAEGIKPDMQAVWEGLGPGFAFAPSYPLSGGFATYLQDRCQDLDSLHWQIALSVFSHPLGQLMYDSFRQALEREMEKYPNNDFGTARFQMANQMRRFLAVAPLTVYANTVLPFTPGLSKSLWDLAGSIPLSVTSGKKLYFRLFREEFPEALSVPVCTGGTLLSQRSFTPGLWLRGNLDSLGHRCRYYWQRLPRLPVIGSTIGRLGLIAQAENERNELLDVVVRHIHPDHPDLNADTVCTLQKAEPPYSWTERLGRRMLFYWQTWRWIMENRLTTWNAETFLQEDGLQGRGGQCPHFDDLPGRNVR